MLLCQKAPGLQAGGPPAFSPAGRAKCAPNARRNSFGSRSAKASHAVTMRISRVVNVWQYSSTP